MAALLCAAIADAKPITPEQALARLGETAAPAKAPAKNRAGSKLVHTALTEQGEPAVYVFNQPNRSGYVLVAADDCALPLLGYADEGEFSTDRMPDAMKWWIGEYARQIQYANDNGIASPTLARVPKSNRTPIAPMITAKWDQIEPFNNMAPLYGTQRTYTGCVATAMAMVLNYWKYPEIGQGSISYSASTIGKRLSLNFGSRAIDWDNMLDVYDLDKDPTQEQIDAVAYLMKACGYSVKMNYSTEASGALAMNIGNALVKYFNYDPNFTYALRLMYSSSEWEQMLYDNLRNVGPILYGGGSMLGGGHSFVCDGYEDGYFHFNWGWSGISNGYFALDALTPENLGSGGGEGGGFNFTQDAVLGVQPATGQPAEIKEPKLVQMGSLNAEIIRDEAGADIVNFTLIDQEDGMWVNYNPATLNVYLGVLIQPQGDTPGTVKGMKTVDRVLDIQAGYGTGPSATPHTINLAEANLADGTYKLTYATLSKEEGSEWNEVAVAYGNYNYVILRKQGDTYTVENQPLPQLNIVDGGFTDRLIYYGCAVHPTITVENPTDVELNKGFAPALMLEVDGESYPFFLGESVQITVPPHSTVTREWVTDLYLLQQVGISSDIQFSLTYFDEGTYKFLTDKFSKPVTLKANPGLPDVVFGSEVTIPGAEVVEEEVIEGQYARVFIVDDKYNIPLETSFRLGARSTFAYTMLACVLAPDWGAESGTYEIIAQSGHPMFLSTKDSPFETTLSIPNAKRGQHYLLTMAYIYGSNYVQVDPYKNIVFRLSDPSAVENVTIETIDEANAPIYNLQGVCLGTDWDSLPAGLYIRSGKKLLKK